MKDDRQEKKKKRKHFFYRNFYRNRYLITSTVPIEYKWKGGNNKIWISKRGYGEIGRRYGLN